MEATGFGVMHVDDTDQVVSPGEAGRSPAIPGKPDKALASMGIYVFNAKFLYDQLRRDAADPTSSRDFGKDLIPYLVPRAKVMAHRFQDDCIYSQPDAEPYWRDVGTIDAYWKPIWT